MLPSASGSNMTCHGSPLGRQRVGFKINSCLEENKHLLNSHCVHCYHSHFSWAPKQNQGFRPAVPRTVLGTEGKMGKAHWTRIRVFQKPLSAAPHSWCWLPRYAVSMATSEVIFSSPAPRSFCPTQPHGQRKVRYMEKRAVETRWCCRRIWITDQTVSKIL